MLKLMSALGWRLTLHTCRTTMNASATASCTSTLPLSVAAWTTIDMLCSISDHG